MRAELKPVYTNQKSFYQKAYIETWGAWNQNINLYSYGVLVAQIGYLAPEDNSEEIFGILLYPDWDCTQTTIKHIKEFMQQYGFAAMTTKEIRTLAQPYCDDYLFIERP